MSINSELAFKNLPPELLTEIDSYLSYSELSKLAAVDRLFSGIVFAPDSDESLWKPLYIKYFWQKKDSRVFRNAFRDKYKDLLEKKFDSLHPNSTYERQPIYSCRCKKKWLVDLQRLRSITQRQRDCV